MKILHFLLIIILMSSLMTACGNNKSQTTIDYTDYEFKYHGDLSIDSTKTYDYLTSKEELGMPSKFTRYEYLDCFNREGERIMPLFVRYIDNMDRFFTKVEWDNYDGNGRRLTLFFESYYPRKLTKATPFWGYLAYPEEEDSILSLYTEK